MTIYEVTYTKKNQTITQRVGYQYLAQLENDPTIKILTVN